MPQLHLFGGGSLVTTCARLALAHGWGVSLRTSERLAGPTLRADSAAAGVELVIAGRLADAMQSGPAVSPGDVAISLGAPWIFKEDWLAIWGGLAFNVHGRRLPEHRGAGGSSWLIMMGERLGMALVHRLTAGVDDGAIVALRPFVYPESVVTPLDHDLALDAEAKKLLDEWLPAVLGRQRAIVDLEQQHHLSTYWPRLATAHHGWIDWDWDVDDIVSFARAFSDPYAGAQTYVRGAAVTVAGAVKTSGRRHHPFQRGLVFRVDENGVHVAARDGTLVARTVRSADGSITPRVGDRLFTPRAKLEAALATRATYLPDGTVKLERMGPGDG